MSRDYSEGVKDGRQDGKKRVYRLAFRSAQRLLKITSYLPGATNRDLQYYNGYRVSFEDEVRIRRVEVISKEVSTQASNSPLGGIAMTNVTSYAYQVELLMSLKQYLATFHERLQTVSENYQRKVDDLHEEGRLMDETYRDFSEIHLAETRSLIRQLCDHIANNDIPAVEKEISFIQQRL